MSPLNAFVKTTGEFTRRLRGTIFKDLAIICICLIAALVIVSFSSNTTVQNFFIFLIGLLVLFTLGSFGIILVLGIFWKEKLLTLLYSEEFNWGMKYLENLGDQSYVVHDMTHAAKDTNPEIPKPEIDASGSDLLSPDTQPHE